MSRATKEVIKIAILSNTPSLSYIYWKDILITYNGNVYQIQNNYTCKPYIYWDVDSPYELITSNTKLKETQGRYYILFNEKGIFTQVPQTDIEISFSENSNRDLITERIVGFQNQFEENEIKFTTIETDVNGIKQTVGTVQEDITSNKQQISTLEQRDNEISAEISSLEEEYAQNEELQNLRDNTNIALLNLQSTLGLFSSDMSTYMEDNKLSDDESSQIDAYKEVMEVYRNDLNVQIDKVIDMLTNQEKSEEVTKLTTQKELLNDSIDNLFTNVDDACIDKIFTNTEITTVITYFSKVNTKINETNNMIDEYIFLQSGGKLVEELSKLTIGQNEIKMSVSETQTDVTNIRNEIKSSIKQIDTKYYLSTNNTTLEGGEWLDEMPTSIGDKYLWSKDVYTYTDDTTSESTPVCLTVEVTAEGGYTIILTDETFIVKCDINGNPL